jgi:DNA-binding winged helix-turn-helix (wHTH) protein
LARGCLLRGGEPMHLRPQSYEVLEYLTEHRERLISKDRLIEDVWRVRAVTDGSHGKCIEEVREALGAGARQYVRNVRGRGYIFDPEGAPPEDGVVSQARSEEFEVVSVTIEEVEKNGEADRRRAAGFLVEGAG